MAEMKRFDWTAELVTGMKLIDEQHEQFGRFANAFLQVCGKEHKVAKGMVKAFAFLQAYARDHLQTEEGLMDRYSYPDGRAHRAAHRKFSSWIEEARGQVETGALSGDAALRINYVLVDWFQRHIRHEDRKLVRYLQQVAEERQDRTLLGMIRGLLHHDGDGG